MHFRIQLIAIVMSIVLTLGILELVRKRRVREEYSLLWLASGLAFLVLSLNRDWVLQLSQFMGVSYGPSALFVLAFSCGLLLAIHFSLILSTLTEKARILAQQNALLRTELSELRSQVGVHVSASDGAGSEQPLDT